MNAKSENPLPPGGLDPETIASDPDLLFDAAKALNDQIADEMSDNVIESTAEKTNEFEKIEARSSIGFVTCPVCPWGTGG